jgi:hypothetical protein
MNQGRGNPVVRDPNFRPGNDPSARMLETLWRMVTGARGQDDITVDQRPSGLVFGRNGPSYSTLFDLYDITNTTLKIRAFKIATTQQNMAIVAGALKAIDNGTASFDADITITAATYFYITDEISSGNTHLLTLDSGTSIPTGGDVGAGGAYYYWPLWYVGWNSTDGKIDQAAIFDLRDFIHLQGFGN